MQLIREIGKIPWSKNELIESLPTFYELFFKNNPTTSLPSSTLFAVGFTIKFLQPTTIIEVGSEDSYPIIEKLKKNELQYHKIAVKKPLDIYPSVIYHQNKFENIPWHRLQPVVDKTNTLVIFYEPLNAFKQLVLAKKMGFKHLLFTHNYPAPHGKTYSLKRALMQKGFRSEVQLPTTKMEKIRAFFNPPRPEIILPNGGHSAYLREVCQVYYEFPPIFKTSTTQWGDAWIDFTYPTPLPLLEQSNSTSQQFFQSQAQQYDWTCYINF